MESSSYDRKVDSRYRSLISSKVESSPLDAACAAVLNNESAHPKVTAKTLLYFARFSMLWSAWLSAREEACLISLN